MCAAYDPLARRTCVHAVRNGSVHHGISLCCSRKVHIYTICQQRFHLADWRVTRALPAATESSLFSSFWDGRIQRLAILFTNI